MLECERYPRLVGRLVSLKDGLDIDPPCDFDHPTESRIATTIVEMYPLKHAIRAARKRSLLKEAGTAVELRNAAKNLSLKSTSLRAIDRGLLDTLVTGRLATLAIRERPGTWRVEELSSPEKIANNKWLWILWPICLMVCGGIVKNIGKPTTGQSTANHSELPRISHEEHMQEVAARLKAAYPVAKSKPISTDTLSAGQINLLARLLLKGSISHDEARNLAATFMVLGSPNPSEKEGVGEFFDWGRFQTERLNERQRNVVSRLRNTNLKLSDVQDLLIEFVRAGGKN